MTKVITEKQLRSAVRKCLNEALKYNKEYGQYFPDYTWEPHRDAGKYASNNRDDFNYSRNDYKWSDPDKQRRFQELQINHGKDLYPSDPDSYGEADAENYEREHSDTAIMEKAIEASKEAFEQTIDNFVDKVAQKFPMLKQPYYNRQFTWELKRLMEELY